MEGRKKVCNTCGGSGEIGYFQGESRFMLTREECPACYGFGYMLDDEEPDASASSDSDAASPEKESFP